MDENYRKGLYDAFDLVKEFISDLYTKDSGLTQEDICNKYGLIVGFGHSISDAFLDTDPEDIMNNVDQYKKTIHVGDEVTVDKSAKSFAGVVFTVTKLSEIGFDNVWGVSRTGQTYCVKKCSLKKTGNRHPELIEVLTKMKEHTNDTI